MCDLNNLNDELMNNLKMFLFDKKSENKANADNYESIIN